MDISFFDSCALFCGYYNYTVSIRGCLCFCAIFAICSFIAYNKYFVRIMYSVQYTNKILVYQLYLPAFPFFHIKLHTFINKELLFLYFYSVFLVFIFYTIYFIFFSFFIYIIYIFYVIPFIL